ncbi:MAG: S8 family serine peptidase, partial [Euryarchaeota archaeon]|nr:S8 family serine peptidase [Euryarchaeota archaeon]
AVVRVLHAVGAGTSADIIKGIEWVKNNQNNVNPPIRVATMSIGFLDPGCGDGTGPEADAANALVASGVPFTIAAGNSGHKECTIDGASAAKDVITVAAVDDQGTVTQDDDVIADFSSGGGDKLAKPDVSFPGVDITSAYIGAGVLIATLSGTSMATPHAAGVAALVRQSEPGLSAQQVKDRITGTAVKTSNTGNSWNSVYGHGLGNACTALQLSGCGSTGGGGNSAPIAAFTYTCTDLACNFDGTGSSDKDGTIASYAWDFGDGSTGSGATVSHSYGAEGTYTVTLTVTDDGGASDTESKAVDVVDTGGSGISLSANGFKVKGGHHVDLTWSGATSTNVDVYRDGSVIATTANDGAYTDAIGAKGGGSYTHKVCEAGTSTCSNSVTTTF